MKNWALQLMLLIFTILMYGVAGCGSGEETENWDPFPRSCCCMSGCPTGGIICMTACHISGGVCNDPESEMRRACEGSTMLGCTCTERTDSQTASE